MKYLAIVVFSLLGIAVLYIGTQLGPAHLQIRSIEVDIPALQEVVDLPTEDQDIPQRVSFVTTAEQSGEAGTIGHVGVLVTWPGGKQLLIDAGMDREAAFEFGELIESLMDADPVKAFGPIEEQLGDGVDKIDGIIFTHLHIDHSQGITSLCKAMTEPASIYQTVDQAREHNLHTEAGQSLVEEASCQQVLLNDETIKSIQGFPGVYAIEAGGHTPGSTIILVAAKEQTWIFSGDLTNDFASIRTNTGKGWLYSTLFVPENSGLLEEWRLWLRDADELERVTVLPAHDIQRMRTKLEEH
ncbi:MAG: MBL fold metallo-hydrolase [Halioglobus sp.]